MMKYLSFLITCILIATLISCSEEEIKPTVVSTEDYSAETFSTVMVGDTVGVVPGTSNKGTVAYTILSQTPQGAFTIGESYGELIVADASAFDPVANPEMNLMVEVRKEDVSKTSNVTISVVEGAACPQVDLSPWMGNLSVVEEGFDVLEGVGSGDECGILVVSVLDPFAVDVGCDQETMMTLQLQPSSEGENNGTVTAENQRYDCLVDTPLEFDATGSYDIDSGIITLDYVLYQEGNELYGGILTITKN
ncbi:cadherin repeat domain-containing protein [Maribacter sp. 2210JD10-5]|uniref:cadherin repeat domain-containing protein n=1 Tax=Maribacter sp. 2210JD10-5 TaxID=3386272 RepID=UPI0039BD72C1